MKSESEFHAATVEEAAIKAAADLGLPRAQLRFHVLDEGSTGFLGIGARDARIVVELDELQSENVSAMREEHTAEWISEPPTEEHAVPSAGFSENVAPAERGHAASDQVPEDLIVAVDEFMTSLLDGMDIDATVDAYDAGEVIAVDVATKEKGLFVGRKGETIDAVQYLSNVVVYKSRAFTKKIVVDAEGYRQRRVEALQGMAHRAARRALREKRSLSLPPMSAAERRVVHLFLRENPDVTTYSEGEEEDRRVVVSPA